MDKSAQKIQIFYEIAMSIGTSLDLHKMLKTVLLTYLRKLNCLAGMVYKLNSSDKKNYYFEDLFSIPYTLEIRKNYELIDVLFSKSFTKKELAYFSSKMPVTGKTKDGNYYHIMKLANFGFLVLIKNTKALEEDVIFSLGEINNKLAQASFTCIDNDRLIESEKRFQTLSASTFEAIFFSENGICSNQNDRAAKMFGYSLDEVIGMAVSDLIHPDNRNTIIENIRADNKQLYEAVAVKKNGMSFPCEIQERMMNIDGKSMKISVFRDITIRKKAEIAFKESEEKYEIIIQSAADMIVIIDKLGNIQFVNDRIEKMLGYFPKDVIGSSFTNFIPRKEIPAYLKKLTQVFVEKEVKNFVTQINHKDGYPVDVEISGNLFRQSGKTLAIGNVRDISFRKKAEKTIEDNRNKLEQYAEQLELAMVASEAGLWDWNIETGEVFFSERWCNMLGYEISEVEPNIISWENKIHPDDKKMSINALSDHIKGKNPLYQTEHRIKTAFGEWKWILNTGRVTKRDKSGKALRVVGTHIDISERKKNEKKLESNEKYLKTINQFATSVLKHNSINDIVWEVVHLTIKELGFVDCIIYLFDDDKKYLIQRSAYGSKQSKSDTINNPIEIPFGEGIVGSVAKTGIPELIPDTSKDPRYIVDDQYRYSELAVPIIADGEVIGVIDTEHPEKNFYNEEHLERLETISGLVSSRIKNAINQEKLALAQVSLSKLSTAIEQSPLSVMITDVNGFIEFVNPAFIETTGYSMEDSIGKKTSMLNSGDHPQSLYAEMWKTINEGKKWIGELINKRKNGEKFWVLNSISPIRNNEGVITNFVAMHADISAHKKLERDLIIAKENAEEANKAKSEFLANMSHEIRTPMNAILGFSEALYHKLDSSQHKKMIKSVLSSGNLLLSLLNDILDLSKIEAGKLEISTQPVDLRNILQDIKLLFTDKAHKKGLEINSHVVNDFPDVIELDEIRIKQVIFNLVGNAIKFTHKGYVNIKADFINRKSNKGDLIIEVKDTGIGIPKSQQEIIFEVFRQQSGQSNRKYGGAGLGLAISKRLVEKMNGNIEVSSEINKGSNFKIRIPKIEVSISKIREKNYSKGIVNIIFEEATILVIDDVSSNIETVENFISPVGLSILSAENGEIALEMLSHTIPELIMLDMKMPGIDGYEVARSIKSNPKLSHIPVIAFTASVFSSDKIENTGDFNGSLFKPINRTELLQMLAKFLKHSVIKTKKQKTEKAIRIDNISKDLKNKLPEILKELKNNLLPKWKALQNQFVLFKIEEFAIELKKLAQKFNFEFLIQYADNIIDDLDIIDLESLNETLSKYPRIINKVEFLIKKDSHE